MCVGCSVFKHSSACSDMFVSGGVIASVTLVTGLGAESMATINVGSLTGGAEVMATGSSCGVRPTSSGELSGSSTVSIVCRPVASLSASVAWSWWPSSNLAAPLSRYLATACEKGRDHGGLGPERERETKLFILVFTTTFTTRLGACLAEPN